MPFPKEQVARRAGTSHRLHYQNGGESLQIKQNFIGITETIERCWGWNFYTLTVYYWFETKDCGLYSN